MLLAQQLIRDWNAEHGNRCWRSVLFCYGSDGWDSFKWEPGDLLEMQEALANS